MLFLSNSQTKFFVLQITVDKNRELGRDIYSAQVEVEVNSLRFTYNIEFGITKEAFMDTSKEVFMAAIKAYRGKFIKILHRKFCNDKQFSLIFFQGEVKQDNIYL